MSQAVCEVCLNAWWRRPDDESASKCPPCWAALKAARKWRATMWHRWGWVPFAAVLTFILGSVAASVRFQPDLSQTETLRLGAVVDYLQARP